MRKDTIVRLLGGFFGSYIPFLELKKPATGADQKKKKGSPNKSLLPLAEG